MTAEARALRLARIAALAFLALTLVELARQFANPGQIDFLSFWAAAKLGLSEAPAVAWDIAAHRTAQGALASPSGLLPFAYPPPFLMIILPLGTLPYAWALVVWLAAGLLAYLAAARPLFVRPGQLWLAAAFPPFLVNTSIGQAAFLTAALFVGGSVLLERRPFSAGLLLGALVIKPHLAVLIPLALLAGREWRAIVGAAISSTGLLLVALLAFGAQAYAGFLDVLPTLARGAAEGAAGWQKFASPYALFRSFGIPAAPAWAGHLLLALGAAAATAVAWWKRHPARLPLLASAAVIVPPYLFAYDQLLLIAAFAWCFQRGFEERLTRWQWTLAGLLWTLPLAQLVAPLALAGLIGPGLLLLLLTIRTGGEACSAPPPNTSMLPAASDPRAMTS